MGVDIFKNPAWFRSISRCRYSHLPVLHSKIFVSHRPGSNYFVDLAKLGDHFLLVKASGYVRSDEMPDALCFIEDYILKYFDVQTGVFLIEDYIDIERVDFGARKRYIDYHVKSDFVWGGVLYHLPLSMRISFKLAQRLHLQRYPVYAVVSYKQAIDLATAIVRQRNKPHIGKSDPAPASESDPEFLSLIASGRPKSIASRIIGKGHHCKMMLFNRCTEKFTRQYATALLEYIESIDWSKDGALAPKVNALTDPSIRKVFEAISYIKSEIDDLLTEKDAAQHILQESEARYRQLVEHAKAGIFEIDLQKNKIISANDSLIELCGYTKEEILSMRPMDLLSPESQKTYADRLAGLFAGEPLRPATAYQLMTKNGGIEWALLCPTICYKDGRPWRADVVLINITHLKETEHKLARYQSKLKKLSIRLSRSEEDQRRQLASRLHESVGQDLYAVQLQLNVLEKKLEHPAALKDVDAIKAQIVQSIQDIRDITADMSPPVLYDLGIQDAIDAMAKKMGKKYAIKIVTRFSGRLDDMDEEVKIIIYRVIKEILHNSIKHARADRLDIGLDVCGSQLHAAVCDNGIGFDPAQIIEGKSAGDGFGLFDIREKISYLEGRLVIDSAPGTGTRVRLEVPLKILSENSI